ncbi:hypothetical protein GRI89_03095 [Altererythrobacter salegens]|uniref:Uncharacterized protein n=1 Tax=Croceibacterium salegens TaxID=1737568 RepID=A0A6I4SSJ6_9SPHN|nr:hypothetical protein [Croceibacterium salegens]MXO58529.1 hypothetical protein [Croceibacterium salegens]
MGFGSPEFVLSIIGMAMFAGVLKSAIRARHGFEDPHPHAGGKRARRNEIARLRDQNTGIVASLREDNARLTHRLESYEDRLRVLERIVTDNSYNLASEIEQLRDRREKA